MSFDVLSKSNIILDAITRKQQVIGSNLANINTPGYVRQDVDFSQLIGAANSPLETKLTHKLGPSPFMNDSGGEVNASQELIEMQKNALYYTIATRNVTSTLNELKTVINVGK